MQIIGETVSLCPECLRKIKAEQVAINDNVFLVKTCPEHGRFQTIIWRGQPDYQTWGQNKLPFNPPTVTSSQANGCPYDCGLCAVHRQKTCCVLLEVTQRCNMSCPVCFAAAGDSAGDPNLETIAEWYHTLLKKTGQCNVQLSGGEPTLRDDLPDIVRMGHLLGFDYIQLNTNGIRLATDRAYLKELKRAGLNCVFLQFDGTNNQIYQQLRGADLWQIKQAAIAKCIEQKIGVVLVPTLVPGVNTNNIGSIIEYAIKQMPGVRGVHFQPVSYFGRYPQQPADDMRMTLPELIRELEHQTGGMMKAAHFHPPQGKNAYCAFTANFILNVDGVLQPWGEGAGANRCKKCGVSVPKHSRSFVARHWTVPEKKMGCCQENILDPTYYETASLDTFLERLAQYSLCISAMLFQDVWNIDLNRLQDCVVHVVHPDMRIIPFCAYNLTDEQGRALYRPSAT